MSNTESRTFPLGAVLTVTTGTFMLDDIGELYKLLSFMTGDELMTHQLPRASDESLPDILRQHPELADITPPEGAKDRDTLMAWLDSVAAKVGSEIGLTPLVAGDHTYIDPLQELAMMAPGVPVIGVVLPEDGDR